MNYTYRLDGSSARYLRRLPRPQAERVLAVLGRICEEPFDERTSSELHGPMVGLRRARAGNLRIVFRVEREHLLVVVTTIGPRGDIYKS